MFQKRNTRTKESDDEVVTLPVKREYVIKNVGIVKHLRQKRPEDDEQIRKWEQNIIRQGQISTKHLPNEFETAIVFKEPIHIPFRQLAREFKTCIDFEQLRLDQTIKQRERYEYADSDQLESRVLESRAKSEFLNHAKHFLRRLTLARPGDLPDIKDVFGLLQQWRVRYPVEYGLCKVSLYIPDMVEPYIDQELLQVEFGMQIDVWTFKWFLALVDFKDRFDGEICARITNDILVPRILDSAHRPNAKLVKDLKPLGLSRENMDALGF